MNLAHRCLVVLREHPDPQIEEDISNGLKPQQNHLEIAKSTMADIVSADTLLKRVGWRNRNRRFRLIAAIIAAFFVRNKYDVIFVTGEDIGLPLALLLRVACWPGRLIVVVHACRGRSKKLFKCIGNKPFHQLICISRLQYNILTKDLGFPERKVSVQADSVDTNFFSPDRLSARSDVAQNSQPYVFACGMENRDYDTLIAAMAAIPARLHIVASGFMGADAEGIKQRTLAIADRVTVEQHVSFEALRRLYAGACVVVVPIHPVDYGAGVNGIMEAMAMAKVVIASDSPGIREYLSEDCTFTVPCHNVPALAAAISKILDSSELDKIGVIAREHAVRTLDMRKYVQSISSVMLGTSL